MTETQQRFLKAIAERVPVDRIVEVRVFPALRQGAVESGVAVVAVEAANSASVDSEVPVSIALSDDRANPAPALSPAPARAPAPAPAPALGPATSSQFEQEATSIQPSSPRFEILTAHYRLTLKGHDRGKWEFELVHDADAPLDTVEQVVRGVAHRVGEAEEAELLTSATFQRALTEPWWSATA